MARTIQPGQGAAARGRSSGSGALSCEGEALSAGCKGRHVARTR